MCEPLGSSSFWWYNSVNVFFPPGWFVLGVTSGSARGPFLLIPWGRSFLSVSGEHLIASAPVLFLFFNVVSSQGGKHKPSWDFMKWPPLMGVFEAADLLPPPTVLRAANHTRWLIPSSAQSCSFSVWWEGLASPKTAVIGLRPTFLEHELCLQM